MKSRLAISSALAVITLILPLSTTAASWWERLLGGPAEEQTATEQPARTLPALDISGGLREALIVGSQRVVAQLGAADGFNLDPSIHIELPQQLQTARAWLDRVGMAGPMDELELRMNRAAEAATPRARELFVDAITSMTIEDARGLLNGGDTAATDYLRGRMTAPLTKDIRPVVDDSLAGVGALQLMDTALENYRKIPFAPAIDVDLRSYVTGKTIDGIFTYLAREEQAIRANPAERTTELLRSVFAGK